MRTASFSVSSILDALPEQVWDRVVRMEGVNDEFFPFLRMSSPRQAKGLSIADAPLGERIFRSWILAFGLVPIDYDDITLVEVEQGRRFLEHSQMLTQRVWQHERILEPAAERATRLTDRIEFEPKLPGGRRLAPVFRLLFRYRHRRLRRRFGGHPVGDGGDRPASPSPSGRQLGEQGHG